MRFASSAHTGFRGALARGLLAPLLGRVGLWGLIGLWGALPVLAQEAPPDEERDPSPSSGVEEIVIQGERIPELGADDTVSTTTFDPESLEALGVQDISDLAAVTPNLAINTISASTATFFIRGVGLNDFASNATGAVAVYQDGVPISSPALQLGQLFDIGGVEVVRGAQAFGNERNASAGMIAASSRLPSGDYEARLRMDLGRFDLRDFEGAIALPLTTEGALSSRLAFRYTERDPYIDNRCGGLSAPTQGACGSSANTGSLPVPPGLPSEVGDESRWAARGLLRYAPLDSEMDWLLNVHGASLDQNATLGQVIGTRFPRVQTVASYSDPAVVRIYDAQQQRFRDQGLSAVQARRAAYLPTLERVTDDIERADPLDGAYDLVGQEKLDSVGGSLRGTLLLGNVNVVTTSGVESYRRERFSNFDFSPDATLHSDVNDRAWQASQSLELGSELAFYPLGWNAGAFFLTENLDSNTNFLFNFNLDATLPERRIRQTYTQDDYSFGVYGNFEWEFSEVFALEAGLRINYDKKDFELAVRRVGNPFPASASETWVAPTGAVALRYLPREGVSVYAKYSRGWKPGVFNAAVLFNQDLGGGTFQPEIRKADPEELDAFEMGMNASWLDETLETRFALFYYKYSDYQVFIFRNRFGAPPQFQIVNANDAQVFGAEVDLYAEPLRGRVPALLEQLVLEARFSWLDSQFLDFTDTNTIFAGVNFVTQVVDFSNNQLPNSPRFKLSASARYAFDLGRFGTITPRYDMTFTDDVFFDPSEGRGAPRLPGLSVSPPLPKYAVGQRAYVLHDLRLSYQLPGERIEISGWVRNLTDERYKSYVAEATGIDSLLNWIGAPRTYGISMSIDF